MAGCIWQPLTFVLPAVNTERHSGCTMTASLPEKTRGGRKRPPQCLFGRYANHTFWS